MNINDSILDVNRPLLQKRGLFPIREDSPNLVDWKEFSLFPETRNIEHQGESILTEGVHAAEKDVPAVAFLYQFGFGTGQSLRKTLSNMPNSSMLVCIEPWPSWFYALCCVEPIDDILRDERFSIGLTHNPVELNSILSKVTRYKSCKEVVHSELHPKPDFDYGEFKRAVLDGILESIRHYTRNKSTLELSNRGVIENASTCLNAGDVDHLREQIAGKPYVAVGLGPSMAAQIETLKEIQGKAVIGVCDNALREILDAGIDPDIVFHVEWRIESLSFYQNLQYRKPMVLCHMLATHPEVVKAWPFKRVCYPSPNLDIIIPELKRRYPWRPFVGTTVGDFAIQFGIYAGASDVYLVGFDNSMPAGSYHHPSTAAMRETYGETSRFWSPEKWDWRHVIGSGSTITVEGWDGEQIYAHSSFRQSIELFNTFNRIKGPEQNIYSCSDYGAKLEVPFKELRALIECEEIEKDFDPSHEVHPRSTVRSLIQKRAKEVSKYFRKIKEIEATSGTYLQFLREDRKEGMSAVRQDYKKSLVDLQRDVDLQWIENLIMMLDTEAARLALENKMARKDMNEEELFDFNAEKYHDYASGMMQYKDFLKQHISDFERQFS